MKVKFLLPVAVLFQVLWATAQSGMGQLPAWAPGFLDIHHIHTGRGDAAYVIFPDGTTLLVDAGDMSETHPRTTSARNAPLVPHNGKTAPQWIVDYIKQFAPQNRPLQLDYALITHYHDDHFGEMDSLRKKHPAGYYLTGITEVGSLLPIKKVVDRGHAFPIDLKATEVRAEARFTADPYGMMPTLDNYWRFLEHQAKETGTLHEALVVGEKDQMGLQYNAAGYPHFFVRNLASNGILWTGAAKGTMALFKKGEYPGENPLSNAIKITYGNFDYFSGGDISGVDALGATDLNAVESHLAPVIGPVDVATLNHHGNRDSQNAYYVRTIRPRVWIQQNWTADHPGEEVLRRILSQQLYPGERDIFATVMLQGAHDVIGERLNAYKSLGGHIVIRVHPQGDTYAIFVLNDQTETREIISKHGPYEAR